MTQIPPRSNVRADHMRDTNWDQGRYADAEPLFKRALAITEKSLGPDHPDAGRLLNNVALLYQAQGRSADAEPLFKRAVAIAEKSLGPDHSDVATLLINLAGLYGAQGRWADGLPLARKATERGYVNQRYGRSGSAVHLSLLLGAKYAKYLSEDEAIAESFDVVQRAASTAASAALSQLGVRFAAGSDDLAQLVCKDQDLSAENQ
jgi:tetratricopeptide (TPR) repeat protein